MNTNLSKENLVNDLVQLGLKEGDLINVKASMRSIGKVEGGAKILIEAILEVIGKTGTIVTDSFVSVYPVNKLRTNKNLISNDQTPSYAGALANEMIKHPDSFRSKHPIQKFSAIGFLAEKLMNNHKPENYAYDVLKVMSEIGGKNLKIGTDEKVVGVGTTHVAIGVLGLKQKRLNYGINYHREPTVTNQFIVNWAGGCAQGFNNFMDDYKAGYSILNEGLVGSAPSKITDMKKTLEIELEILKKNPSYFLCNNPKCINCRLTWEFQKESIFKFFLKNSFNISPKEIYKAFRIVITGSFQPTKQPVFSDGKIF